MLLTRDNSDEAIMAGVAKFGRGHRFWDGKTGKLFSASPCENCGKMSASADALTIERPSEYVHRAMSGVFTTGVDYNECIGYDDDGVEVCESCG